MTSQSTGTKTYTIQGRCSLDGKFAVENAVLENKKAGNCENPSLKMVFDKIFPSIDVMKTTQQLINPDSFFFEKLEINRGTKEVTVEAKAKDSWRLLSGDNFVLGGASLTLGFKAGEPVDGIKSWKIKAEGEVFSLRFVFSKCSWPKIKPAYCKRKPWRGHNCFATISFLTEYLHVSSYTDVDKNFDH